MAKSPNFLLRTAMPWERISLQLDLTNMLGPALWNQCIVMLVIGIEFSLPGALSPIIIWALFFVLHCIHLSLYCNAGKRVLKQIDLRIWSTVVFFLKYLEARKSTLTILCLCLLFLPTAAISRAGLSCPHC
jgi:hypothetical protein